MFFLFITSLLLVATSSIEACTPSATTVSGTYRPQRICSGQLIFEDNFNNFDLSKWQHEVTLGGGSIDNLQLK
jgi:hypothetical protein